MRVVKRDKSLEKIEMLLLMIPIVIPSFQNGHPRFKLFGTDNRNPVATYRFGQNCCPIGVNNHPARKKPVVKIAGDGVQRIATSSMSIYLDEWSAASEPISLCV